MDALPWHRRIAEVVSVELVEESVTHSRRLDQEPPVGLRLAFSVMDPSKVSWNVITSGSVASRPGNLLRDLRLHLSVLLLLEQRSLILPFLLHRNMVASAS